MTNAAVTIDRKLRVAPVRRRLFGSFVEHLGRCVYTGIHEPGHPTADAEGFRRDVLDLVQELGVTTIRYPGGNFVSSYRWEDGVGPVAQRPVRLDLAWHSTEPNTVGVNEFMRWCRLAGVEPMLAVNLGTRGIQEAVDLLEYCNIESGTHLSDLRREHGAKDAHDVRMWCLGNEMDGSWQVGRRTAVEYGRLAAQTAHAMRLVDPKLELVVCGSSSSSMSTFGAWEADVLAETYDEVDYISAHAYYEEHEGDTASFLASAVDMDYFIDSVVAAADLARAKKKAKKRIAISFDEWNVWYLSRTPAQMPTASWPVAPRLLEDRYSVADAVTVGGLLICLLRHSDRVHAASLAQLVNVIAPIMTEPGGRAWRQTTFHPFALTARYATGDVLAVQPTSPQQETRRYGDVPVLDAVATVDGDGQVAVFAVNRSPAEPLTLTVDARSLGETRIVECVTLSDPDIYRFNTADEPDAVTPRPNRSARMEQGRVELVLPAVSWTMLRLSPAR
ncbi:arabinosylfuranosidase ArfA [Phytohabitans houttuyneae]|uniref:non-reducing end alpha-L-arabinofuranosidase n=1 Tax=Phytohabitans houttuyneae TaxID=1076126 RepID=A0A6V8KCF0_9ACTN|nr:alpha-N-arabinofuranosidase [Phytohabitans houttuyneae]GFJ81120.1 alpha-N-arabinofuranosidase [Phytohabitans houttuyneae]